jgi:hypothetical protein
MVERDDIPAAKWRLPDISSRWLTASAMGVTGGRPALQSLTL